MKIRRSLLLVPAGDARKIDKSREAGADMLMFDLQDSIPFDDVAKRQARDTLAAALDRPFAAQREVNVRVNAVGSPWLREDLEMVLARGVDSVTLPESRTAGDLLAFEGLLRALCPAGRKPPAVLMDVETPPALCDLYEIAKQASLVDGMMVGVNDYALEVHSSGALFGLGGEPSSDHLSWIRPKAVAVARSFGWTVADALMLKDPKDLVAATAGMEASARVGFDGWVVLYPPQVPEANRVFAPSAQELAWAEEVQRSYAREQAVPAAERQATVRRQHLQRAQWVLERGRAVAAGR